MRTPIRPLACALLSVLAGCSSSASHDSAAEGNLTGGMRDVVLVGNSVSGTVTFLDGHTFENLGSIDAIADLDDRLNEIHADPVRSVFYGLVKHGQLIKHFEPSDGDRFIDDVFLSPDGGTLYVSRSNLGDVVAFDLTRAEHPIVWRTLVDGFKADHATLSPDGTRLVVSATTVDKVDVLDAKTGAIVGSFDGGHFPHQNDFSADGKHIYNGSIGNVGLPSLLNPVKGDRLLTVVDAETLEVVRTYEFDVGIRPAVITSDESTMFAQLSYLNGLVKFDLKTGTITATLEEPLSDFAVATYPTHDDFPHDSAHHGLALSGDGKRLCDAGTIDNTVSIVQTDTMTVEKTIDVGMVPYWATTSVDGQSCIVSLSGDGAVSIIDYATGKETKRVPVGTFPQRNRLARTTAGALASLKRD